MTVVWQKISQDAGKSRGGGAGGLGSALGQFDCRRPYGEHGSSRPRHPEGHLATTRGWETLRMPLGRRLPRTTLMQVETALSNSSGRFAAICDLFQ